MPEALHELTAQYSLALERHVLEHFGQSALHRAMSYALNGGKRLRPLMVLGMAEACSDRATALKQAMPAALAVEFIHTYSLIHDDLPAMDNDDMRRGRASVHKKFTEGLAILAGDAFLTDAFAMLAHAPHNPDLLMRELAVASGSSGMVMGQASDLAGQPQSQEQWLHMIAQKTARLFEASASMGALSVGASKAKVQAARIFGHHFGMAFQCRDDLDDQDAQSGMSYHDLQLIVDWQLSKAHDLLAEISSEGVLKELIYSAFVAN